MEDIKEGKGRIVLTSGEVLEGHFLKGLLNGGGLFTSTNGLRVESKWQNNLMIVD